MRKAVVQKSQLQIDEPYMFLLPNVVLMHSFKISAQNILLQVTVKVNIQNTELVKCDESEKLFLLFEKELVNLFLLTCNEFSIIEQTYIQLSFLLFQVQ